MREPMSAALRRCLAPVVTIVAVCAVLASGAFGSDRSLREWNQTRGDAAGTGRCLVEPVRGVPSEVWRLALGEPLCEPVAWGGILYVAVSDGRKSELVAIDVASGAKLASVAIGKGEPVDLAVWEGTVVCVAEDELSTYARVKDRLRRVKRLKGTWSGLPVVHDGLVFVAGEPGTLHCVDIETARSVGSAKGGTSRPCVIRGAKPGEATVVTVEVYKDRQLKLSELAATGLDTRAVELRLAELDILAPAARVRPGDERGTLVSHLGSTPEGRPVWLVRFPGRLTGFDPPCGSCISAKGLPRRGAPIDLPAAVHGGQAYGFSVDDELVRCRTDTTFERLVEDLPAGARAAPATIATDVLYLGNWAVDIETRRILWSIEGPRAGTPLLPVADRRLVFVDAEGALVCIGDGDAAGATEAMGADASLPPPSAPGADASLLPPSAPGSGDGVVLADGRRLAGTVVDDGETIRVRATGGDEEVLAASSVALIEAGAETRVVGEAYPVYRAWRRALQPAQLAVLIELFGAYRDVRLLDDCSRVLDEAHGFGLTSARQRELDESLTGRSQNRASNAERQRARILADERSARSAAVLRHMEAAEWCRARGLTSVASALVADADAFCPEEEALLELAATLVPETFFWFGERDAVRRWLRWAPEILPSSGVFVSPAENVKELAGTPWEHALYVRTPNLDFRSLEQDPALVGRCLRSGEGVVRVLQTLLPDGRGFDDPLDVRLHVERDAYIEEMGPLAETLSRTAGYYAIAERVSRFFVSRAGHNQEPLGRDLFKTLVHEVTHQYLAERWVDLDAQHDPRIAGYWIVEGFARFVEDQYVELGERAFRLDDPRATSVDATSQVLKAGGLIPLERLLAVSQVTFHELDREQVVTVQLRSSVERRPLDEIVLFYEEAGSLVFFLMNEAGPQRREALLEFMAGYYSGVEPPDLARALGFASTAELEAEFHAFLRRVAG